MPRGIGNEAVTERERGAGPRLRVAFRGGALDPTAALGEEGARPTGTEGNVLGRRAASRGRGNQRGPAGTELERANKGTVL